MARRITPKTKSRAWWGQHRWSIAHMSGGSRTASVEHAGSLPSCVHPHFPSPLGRRLQLSTQSIRGVPAPLSRRNCAGGICGTTSSRPCRELPASPSCNRRRSPSLGSAPAPTSSTARRCTYSPKLLSRERRSSCSITTTCSATTSPPGPEFGKYQRSRSLSHGLRRSRHCSVSRVWHAWRQSVASYRLSRSRG